jgi:hypothetical protein
VNGADSREFRLTDPRQRRIHERLGRLVGPGAAAFFRDACSLLEADYPPQTLTHIVGHCLREIESAIRDVLEFVGQPPPKPRGGNGSRDQVHRDEIVAILAFLGITEDDAVAENWLALAGSENEHGLAARAHRDSLRDPRPIDADFRRFWEAAQQILDLVLDRYETKFGAAVGLLEGLLSSSSPTTADAKLLAKHVPDSAIIRREFFAKADAKWLAALKDAGFFRRPPAPVLVDGGPRCYVWPESGYLARMAATPECQAVVLEVILPIADTQNFWVQEDILDAALALPVDTGAQLVPAVKGWLGGPISIGLPEKVGAFIRRLAHGRQAKAALDLAGTLLRPNSERVGNRAKAEFDLWFYEKVLQEDVPDLVRAGGNEAFVLLCDLLEQTVRTSDGDFRDHSQIWRPSIADHGQNELPSIESALVSAARDAAATLMTYDPTAASGLVRELESRRFTVFRRLALHVVRAAGESVIGLVESCLVDRDRFFDPDLLPEYAFLLRDSFGRLSPAGQAEVLELIETGPELDLKRYEEWLGRVPTTEEVERYFEDWQFEKLGFIEESLTGEWRKRYEQLLAKFGEPKRPREFRFWATSWIGPTSPVTKDALAALDDEDLVSLLKTWQASGQDMSPSPEGLGRELTSVAAEEPQRFSNLAPSLVGLDAVYVAALLRGYKDALQKGGSVSWPPLFEFCTWAVNQQEAVPPTDGQGEWSNVREDVAYLIQAGLPESVGDRGIPFSLRTEAWTVIERCVADADPTPGREARNGGDPYGTAINSARGAAMEAAIAYGLWVKRHSGAEAFSGLADVPELRAVLDEHLDPTRDSSLAIRSIYGRHFSQLTYLDRDWAEARAMSVFPLGSDSDRLRETAWDCYLEGPMYDSCYEILSAHYSREVDDARVGSSETPSPYSPLGHFAGHLMALYWRGHLDFADPEGVLSRFFRNSSDQLRAEAIDCVGRSLPRDLSAIEPEVRERLERFFDWRIAQARQAANPQGHQEELAAFGRWFASPVFEGDWALARFKETLELGNRLRPSHLELERLAALASAKPLEAVECLRLMNDLDQNGMLVLGVREEPMAILAAAIRGVNAAARQAGIALVNRLIARGHLGFAELLRSPRADPATPSASETG